MNNFKSREHAENFWFDALYELNDKQLGTIGLSKGDKKYILDIFVSFNKVISAVEYITQSNYDFISSDMNSVNTILNQLLNKFYELASVCYINRIKNLEMGPRNLSTNNIKLSKSIIDSQSALSSTIFNEAKITNIQKEINKKISYLMNLS